MMSSYRERKLARVRAFEERRGVKMIKCVACNGSGYYDDDTFPLCSSCGGTGKCLDELKKVQVVDSATVTGSDVLHDARTY